MPKRATREQARINSLYREAYELANVLGDCDAAGRKARKARHMKLYGDATGSQVLERKAWREIVECYRQLAKLRRAAVRKWG